MLAIFSKYLFIGYSLAIFFLIIIFNFQNEIIQNKDLLTLLFLPILIPFFEKIFEFIKNDSIFNFKFSTENIIKIIAIFVLILFLFFYKNIDFYQSLTLTILFFGIFFAIDERYFFLGSLVFLVLVILNLILKNSGNSEIFSIYLYYFLCSGVLVSILNSTLNKEINTKKEKNFLEKYKNENLAKKIFYFSFIFYVFFIIFGIISGNIFFIKYFTFIFLLIYFFSKFFGFKINFEIGKKEFKGIFFFNIYIIIGILSVILFKINIIENNFNIYLIIFLFIINIILLNFIN